MAKKPQEHIVDQKTHRLVFSMEGKGKNGVVVCKAYKKNADGSNGEQTLDWNFPNLVAISPLTCNALVLTEQAMMYANDPNCHPKVRSKG